MLFELYLCPAFIITPSNGLADESYRFSASPELYGLMDVDGDCGWVQQADLYPFMGHEVISLINRLEVDGPADVDDAVTELNTVKRPFTGQ